MPDRLTVRGHLCSWSGWGHVAERVALGLHALGRGVAFEPTHIDDGRGAWDGPPSPELVGLIREPDPSAPVLHVGPPIDRTPPPGCVWLTMWESDGLPAGSAERLNRSRLVVVPTEWGREVFRRHGVTVPVEVCPLGIEPGDWPCPPRDPSGPLVFGASGRVAHGGVRKGLDDVIAAFCVAFPDPGAAGVRLEVKCWPDCRTSQAHLAAPGVVYHRAHWDAGRLAAWYGSLDVYATASRGEGWGLQTHQAMACGAAVACVPWGGHGAYWTPECGWEIPWRAETCPAGPYAGQGWAAPDAPGLARLLREIAATPRVEIHARGRAAAARAREYIWAGACRRLAEILDARPCPAPPRAG